MLLGLREDFDADKGDIIHKYTLDEARNLQSHGELPDNALHVSTPGFHDSSDEDCGFDFEDI